MDPSLPNTYKAIQCAKPNGSWDIVTIPLHPPAPKEVLVRVHASGICNSDHFLKDGTWPGTQYPRVPGHEVIGRIAAVGTELLETPTIKSRLRIGGLVGVGWRGGVCNRCDDCRKGEFWTCTNANDTGFTIDGGHAEYIYVPDTGLVHIPEEVLKTASYAELAPLCCAGTTAFGAINTSKWSPGDICLVQGLGGIGHLVVQYASKLGMKVYVTSSGGSKRDLALSLGATEHIDSSKTNVVEYIQSLGGAGLIICTAPYSDVISSVLPAVAKNGTITLVSAATDGPIQVSNLLLNMSRATLRGYACGCASDTEQCIKYSALGNVKAMVKEFSIDQFTEAYNSVMDNTAVFRNVIVFP
ncbi:predicted protein [Paecilomyces variotii No. 5]|uniref:Enoyl reductase (ER) domain-containing protein n=1 Tax=Byssochlamys spectabilis (strain No. 5 / NBRC 109023) TaxID=1356009 RepID=V5G1E4_BYSSN|nr:predicted protein [Paecilomyces variotii No. 5]